MEEWKEFNENTLISNQGRVKFLKGTNGRKSGIYNGFDNNGKHLRIWINYKRYLVHSLVYELFKEPYNHKTHCVHHINFNPQDNRLSNLILLTNQEHTALHNKLKEFPHKKVFQYDKQLNLINVYEKICDCEIDGFNHSLVSACCLGKRKTHKGYIWSYEKLS